MLGVAEDLEHLGRLGLEAWALRRLLGGTLDYLGRDALPAATERAWQNLGRVLTNAYGKLGPRQDEAGAVPPRVLRGILEEAPYAEDELVVEYLGGVLASSRSGVSRDDRGVIYLALVARLSAYDLRLHYIAYATVQHLLHGQDIDLGHGTEAGRRAQVFLPQAAVSLAMDFASDEDGSEITEHGSVTLHKEGLIDSYASGSHRYLAGFSAHIQPEEEGFAFVPSQFGIQLYLYAHGLNRFADFLEATGKFGRALITVPSTARVLPA